MASAVAVQLTSRSSACCDAEPGSAVMATGHHAAVCAQVEAGQTVAVVGDGAVGLSGVLAAKRMGAERIIALSRHADRQELAKEFGATDIVAERSEEAVAAIKEMTDGVGVDATLEPTRLTAVPTSSR